MPGRFVHLIATTRAKSVDCFNGLRRLPLQLHCFPVVALLPADRSGARSVLAWKISRFMLFSPEEKAWYRGFPKASGICSSRGFPFQSEWSSSQRHESNSIAALVGPLESGTVSCDLHAFRVTQCESPLRGGRMKGPGLRIDIDVRRAWKCPTCGRVLRLGLEVTAPRCFCVRDGVRMKLLEDPQWGKKLLRPEVRAVLERIQAGEAFPRLQSVIPSDSPAIQSEGQSGDESVRPSNRPRRPERSERRSDRPPREAPPSDRALPAAPPASVADVAPGLGDSTPSRTEKRALPDASDDFGAGLGMEDGVPPS
jgi:hypothetical protein